MNDYDKRLAEASKTLGGNVMKMIGLILQKHDAAVIEASMEAIEAAVAAEREACAKVCEAEANRAKWNWDNDISGNQPFWNGGKQLASSCAAAIRARGEQK